MSEASINQVFKRIGYHGKVTGHGFRHTMSTILHEQGYNSAWIEINWPTSIKTPFAAPIIMLSISTADG